MTAEETIAAPRRGGLPLLRGGPPQADAQTEAGQPRRGRWYQLWFALPAIVLVVVFFFVPFVANAFFAFTQWTGLSKNITFNGLANFVTLIKLDILVHATVVTLCYAVIAMIAQNTIGIVLGKALQRSGSINTVFRSLFFIPVLISPLAAGYIWRALLQQDGFVNEMISLVVPGFDFNWLGNDVTALIAVALIESWKWSGMATLIYIAGFNRIPRQITEAALLDGAGPWRRFWGIEFPLLAPAFTFNIVVTLVGAFSAFDTVVATTNGGPGNATSVLNKSVFDQYGQGLFGTASALSFVVTLLVIVTAVPLIAWLSRREVRM